MKTILAVLLLLAPLFAGAEPSGLAGLPAVLETKPSPGQLPARLRTLLGLQLGKSSLEDVQRTFPGAEVFRFSSADGASKAVCIQSSDPLDDTRVVFEAGALGGYRILTAVIVGPSAAFGTNLTKCIASTKVNRAKAVAGDIRLGGSLEKAARSLKTSVQVSNSGLSEINLERFPRHFDKTTGKTVETEISSGVVAKVERSHIIWFAIYFVEGS